jgi:hypothetical protein
MDKYSTIARAPNIKTVLIAEIGSTRNSPALITSNNATSDIRATETPITPTIIELTPVVKA